MAKKQKVEKMPFVSKAALRIRFEERLLTSHNTNASDGEWLIRKEPSGNYTDPAIQQRWLGFLLAYDKGANALTLRAPSPEVYRIMQEMRAVARERQTNSSPDDAIAHLLDVWANVLESRPDSFYEDVYEQLVEMIDPQVGRAGLGMDGPFPPSVVDTVGILLDHFNATRAAREITPGTQGQPLIGTAPRALTA